MICVEDHSKETVGNIERTLLRNICDGMFKADVEFTDDADFVLCAVGSHGDTELTDTEKGVTIIRVTQITMEDSEDNADSEDSDRPECHLGKDVSLRNLSQDTVLLSYHNEDLQMEVHAQD